MKIQGWKKISGLILLAVIIFTIIWLIKPSYHEAKTEETEEIELKIPEPKLLYGLKSDSFHLEEGIVGRNDNLSNILTERGVSQQVIDKIARTSQPVFDVRKIKAGSHYIVFYSPDSLRTPCYLVYENNAIDYYVFNLSNDSIKVTAGKKEVITKRKTASGTITSSLWNTIKDNSLSPMLALELSEIYAWTIDFYGLQKGDRFKVIYDEEYIGDESIGVDTIYTALFVHGGEPYYAFRFTQDNEDNYFDEKGINLRKSFLKSPLKFSARISSRFSNSRFHPVLRIRRPHHGVDYAAPAGTPVYSIGDGFVTKKGYEASGGGNYIRIKHNSIYETSYMHLSGFAKGIRPGVKVSQGELIGFVGMTGLATGPHLDFRVYMSGTPVNPLKVKSPPAEPVRPENFSTFITERDSLLKEMNHSAPLSGFPIAKK